MGEAVSRDEFDRLETRVAVLEGDVSGEKSLARHIFEQTRANSRDLAELIGWSKKVDRRFETIEAELRSFRNEFDGFRKEFPSAVAEVMREVLREKK